MTKFNLKKAEKTKNQTQLTGIIKIIVIIGAIPFFIAPFIHIIAPKKSEKVKEQLEYFNQIKKEHSISLKKLKQTSLSNNVSYKEYLNNEIALLKKHESVNNKITNQLSHLKENDRVFGFRTLRIFLIGFGTRIVILFLSIILFISFFIENKSMRNTIKHIAFSFIGVGLFLNIWFLWDGNDYPQSFYYSAIAFMTVIGLVLTYVLASQYERILTKFKGIINKLIIFIIRSDKYIEHKETKTQHLEDYLTEFEKISE